MQFAQNIAVSKRQPSAGNPQKKKKSSIISWALTSPQRVRYKEKEVLTITSSSLSCVSFLRVYVSKIKKFTSNILSTECGNFFWEWEGLRWVKILVFQMKKNTKICSVLQTAFCQHCTTITHITTISNKQYYILASVEIIFSSLPPSSIHPSSLPFFYYYCCSVAKSNSLRPHGLQDTRLPCPSLSPGVCSNSCALSWR